MHWTPITTPDTIPKDIYMLFLWKDEGMGWDKMLFTGYSVCNDIQAFNLSEFSHYMEVQLSK